MKAYLNLTDAQLQQLNTLQTNHVQANSNTYSQIAEQQRILSEQLSSESPSATIAGSAAVSIANLNKQLKTANQQHRTAAMAVLTEAQRPKLQQLDAASKLGQEIGEATMLGLLEGSFGGGFPIPFPVSRFFGSANSADSGHQRQLLPR